MFRLPFRKKQKMADGGIKNAETKPDSTMQSPDSAAQSPDSTTLSTDSVTLSGFLDENINAVARLFTDVDILRIRRIENNHNKKQKYAIVYIDGVVDSAIMNDNLIKPLMVSTVQTSGKDLLDTVMNQIVQINDIKKTNQMEDIVEAVAYGDTVLFVDGAQQALILNTKNFQTRPIAEPENEKNLAGPREGFSEIILLNLSLIRRKILSPDLKMKFLSLGRRTKTKVCVCYIDGLVNKQILEELMRRLNQIDIDAVLDTGYINELIKDAQTSPFRTIGDTERPDVVIGNLMEGRIAVFLDGSPSVLTVPFLFIENFQSSEDYYVSFFYSSFMRMLRISGFFLTITVPAMYIAVVAFHHEMMPIQLFINIASERQGVPLPAALEAILMLIVFDVLRESGIRMPTGVGQALSIVGALVIGQAAVEAKLVAAPMIIVVAFTGITKMLLPKMPAPMIYLRLFLLILASSFGFFGVVLGLSCIAIHIINLRSFGIPQVTLTANLKYQEVKDTYIRAPWWTMIRRPRSSEDKVRQSKGEGGHA
ncbi:MAG: spore germination protein [Clostridiales bacterium]|nr:spore germination protein [Clostridiales bacterium]